MTKNGSTEPPSHRDQQESEQAPVRPVARRFSLSSGTELGPYGVTELIGSGGMGEVYRAHDPRLGRDVAIKILSADLAQHPELQRRFEREIRAVSGLSHKNICTIYDTGQHKGQPFIVMELMEGETLESILRAGPLPPDRLLDIGIQVADALDVAHRAGIVHRDIKSANVFVSSRGDAKVLDFGVAKVPSELHPASDGVDTAITDAGTTVGTVSYMSPEQAQGEEVDARSDIFSLGVVLYQMATGSLPFRGSLTATLYQLAASDPAVSPLVLNPSLPEEIGRIILRALEKDRQVRYQTASDMLADLRRLRRGLVSGKTPVGPPTAPSPVHAQRRRHMRFLGWSLGTIGIVAMAIVAGVVIPRLGSRIPIQSIAVLPCSSPTGGVDMEYLCDVLSENLIASLDQIPDLVVMSREVVKPYKGSEKSVMEIGGELDVDAVLTGDLNENAELLLLAVEVTDVRNGAHIWSRRYESPVAEVQGLQEAIALDVADNLRLRLSARDRARLNAYNTYQEAQYHWNKRTKASLERAISLFNEIIAEDPRFAPAHAGLARSYALLPYYGDLSPAESYSRAKSAAEEALRLDETLADAHAALGLVLRDFDRDWLGAENEFRRAIELDATSGTALQWYAEFLAMVGRFDDAEERIQEAQRVTPLLLPVRAVHGWILLCAGKTEEARVQLQATLEMDRDFAMAHWFLGELHVQLGEYGAAVEELERAVALAPGSSRFVADLGSAYGLRGDSVRARGSLERLRELAAQGINVSRYEYALVYAGLGEYDRAFQELESALEERIWQVVNMKVDPMLEPLRADPRYPGLVRRVGLPVD